MELADIRYKVVVMIRFLVPQRDESAKLIQALTDDHKASDWTSLSDLKRDMDQLKNIVDVLNGLRSRAKLAQEELVALQSSHMNKIMTVLTVVNAIFLPLAVLAEFVAVDDYIHKNTGKAT